VCSITISIMFDFLNLDDIDENAATPEWLKWQGVPEWQRAPEETLAVLEEDREETFAPPNAYNPEEEEYSFESIDPPSLPEADAFDPLDLQAETGDGVQAELDSLNGQVIVNFASSAVEEFMLAKRERDEYKAYIDNLHQQRIQYLQNKKAPGGAVSIDNSKKGPMLMDRKPFSWREIKSSVSVEMKELPGGAAMSECPIIPSVKMIRTLVPIVGGAMMPPHMLLHMLIGFAAQVRPAPPRGFGKMKETHIALTDVFCPTGMIVNEASDVINQKTDSPTLVHMVAMSVNKEQGEPEPEHLLQNIKLPTPSSYPSIKPRSTVRR